MVSRETMEQLNRFEELVRKWNRSINLVSSGDHKLVWSRHIQDSLQFLPLIPRNVTRGLDLGSGAGFPGVVLALVSGLPFDLVEADHRKAAFLLEVQRVTKAPIQVHCKRIEDLVIPRVPLITARALAPLTTLLEYTECLLSPSGTALFAKGLRADDEITAAQQCWHMQLTRHDNAGLHGSTILAITGVMHA